MTRQPDHTGGAPAQVRTSLLAGLAPVALYILGNAALQLGVLWRSEQHAATLAFEPTNATYALSYLGFSALLVSLPAVVLLGLGCLDALVWRVRGWRPALPLVVFAESLLLVVLIADSKLFETMGLHLHSPLVHEVLSNPRVDRELHLGGASAISMGVFGGIVLALQLAMVWLAFWSQRHLEGQRQLGLLCVVGVLTLGAGGAVAGPMVSSAAQVHASYLTALPFYEPLFAPRPEPLVAGAVHYPPPVPDAVLSRTPDIVFVVAESLRADAFRPELMPNAMAYAEAHGCWTSQAHYSGAHTTEYGVFNLLYAVYGFNYEPFARERVASYPLQILRANGYRLLGASASSLREWNRGGFMLEAFDRYDEFLDEPADVGDRQVTAALTGVAQDGPSFLFAFFNATHHNYLYPTEMEQFTPVVPRDYDHFMGDTKLAEKKEPIRNRYKNSVLYVDSLFGELMGQLSDADEKVVLLTGDHGEEFWEHGLLGHGAPRFVDERIRVPLMLCVPGEHRRRLRLSSHVDLWPTIFELLGASPASLQGWTQGQSLAHDERRGPVVISGLDFPWDNPTAALVDEERKVWLRLCAGDAPCLELDRASTWDDRPLDASVAKGWSDDVAHLLGEVQAFVELR